MVGVVMMVSGVIKGFGLLRIRCYTSMAGVTAQHSVRASTHLRYARYPGHRSALRRHRGDMRLHPYSRRHHRSLVTIRCARLMCIRSRIITRSPFGSLLPMPSVAKALSSANAPGGQGTLSCQCPRWPRHRQCPRWPRHPLLSMTPMAKTLPMPSVAKALPMTSVAKAHAS